MEFSSYGYLATLSPMQAGRTKKSLFALVRYDGKVMSRAEFVAYYIRNGGSVRFAPAVRRANGRGDISLRDEYRLDLKDRFYSISITKTEYNFGKYLEMHGATEEAQNRLHQEEADALLAAELGEQEAAHLQAKGKNAKLEKRKSHKKWLHDTAKTYLSDSRYAILDAVFREKYSFHPPADLLVLIDNIDDSLCKESLKEYLHTMNRASRQAFSKITGIKLPSTIGGTNRIIDTLSAADIKPCA